MKEKDLYAILGVSRTASIDEIRKAYRKLARKHHPDVNPGSTAAEERFKEVSQAHDILSDPEKRTRYDEFGMAGMQAGFDADRTRQARSRQRTSGPRGGTRRAASYAGYTNFEDIFGDIFGEWGYQGGQHRGADLESELEIEFLDAVRGRSTTISINRAAPCRVCSGSGVDMAAATTCPSCGGEGRQRIGRGPVAFTRACERCGGLGRINPKACASCAGAGQQAATERLTVHIPAGVETGSRVRVAGKGNPGVGGGRQGDLFIAVRVRLHPILDRRGADLYMDLPVTVGEVVHGTTITVPTPDGDVRVRIPSGSQAGRQLRVKRYGVPHLRGKGRGDLYLRLAVQVPDQHPESVIEASHGLDAGYSRNPRDGLRL